MRVLIDIAHPSGVRFFQPLIGTLLARGDDVRVTAQYKPGVGELLAAMGIEHRRICEAYPTPLGIGAAALVRAGRLLGIAARFRPHLMLGRVAVPTGIVGRLLGIPVVSFDENEHAIAQLLPTWLLATAVCTSMGYERNLGRKQLRFGAVSQLAYTHPSRFEPDRRHLRECGLDPQKPYAFVRLSNWRALHDLGSRPASEDARLSLVRALEQHARPVVSSEGSLPPSLASYANSFPAHRALHLLAFARLYVGEGGSMAAEAACLGTPAIWISTLRCGYLNVLRDRYGLVRQVATHREAAALAARWLREPDLAERAAAARRRLLADSQDPLEFMLRMVDQHARPQRARPTGRKRCR